MVVRRGDIWWASLPGPRGSEPAYRRPVVVVQSDAFNRSRISTVIAAVITSNLALASAPGNVELTRKQSGLPKASVINVSQIVTLDRAFLSRRVGRLAPKKMSLLENGLRLVLSI